jgi:hypothetical protein
VGAFAVKAPLRSQNATQFKRLSPTPGPAASIAGSRATPIRRFALRSKASGRRRPRILSGHGSGHLARSDRMFERVISSVRRGHVFKGTSRLGGLEELLLSAAGAAGDGLVRGARCRVARDGSAAGFRAGTRQVASPFARAILAHSIWSAPGVGLGFLLTSNGPGRRSLPTPECGGVLGRSSKQADFSERAEPRNPAASVTPSSPAFRIGFPPVFSSCPRSRKPCRSLPD